MVWKNPFQMKNSEEQVKEREFLALFDCTVLQMIDESNLSKVSFVSSTPGAGKTSLFRAFTPKILNTIVIPEHREEYKDIYKQMNRLGVISEGRVVLASATLSCALNYSIIDEMFENGRRKQIFFALLNYRIAIVLLRSIGYLLDIDISSYNKISFSDIPYEMLSEEEAFKDGFSLYQWACKGERELCRYLDSDRSEQLDVSFVHTSLLMIKLFEATNILFNGKQYFEKTLIVFDDFHKLADNQKKYLSETIYTLKTTTGIWFGQRLEGVKNEQIISMDGSLSRDYNPNIVIDNYWPDSSKVFYSMLESIANRRAREALIGSCHKFSDCIMDYVDEKKYSKVLNEYIKEIRNRIQSSREYMCLYQDILEYIDSQKMSIFDKAIWFECIQIKENRKNSGQLSLFLGEHEKLSTFKKFVKDNEKSARYYICYKCNIPYYVGFSNLCILSSYNVQQFLVFAGDYFDCYRIKTLDMRVSPKKYALTVEEQMQVLQKAVQRRWDDMDLRYTDIAVIKQLLSNIAKWGCESRDAERNSYAGGAYTGIGISNSMLKQNIDNPKYALLIKTLGECLASKYLERREINKGEIVVFYLNRWLCVYYQLPLAYGGWKKCSLDKALQMCEMNNVSSSEDGQIELFL